MNEEAIKTRNGLIITVAVMAVIIFIIGIFFTGNIITWLAGLGAGTLLAIGRVFFLAKSLDRSVDMDKETAAKTAQAHYTLRYVVTLVLAVAVILMGANPIGVIVGLVLVQPAVYIYNFIFNKRQH